MADIAKGLRSRTFTGCRTCRSRHAKCDEAQPACRACLTLGIVCEGYEPQLCWRDGGSAGSAGDSVSSGDQAHRSGSYRYPLFTEPDRCQMSLQISESIGDRTAMDVLLGLDAECEKRDSEDQVIRDVRIGPFSVFDSRRPITPNSTTTRSTVHSSLTYSVVTRAETAETAEAAETLASFPCSSLSDGARESIEEIPRNPCESQAVGMSLNALVGDLQSGLCDDDDDYYQGGHNGINFGAFDLPFLDFAFPNDQPIQGEQFQAYPTTLGSQESLRQEVADSRGLSLTSIQPSLSPQRGGNLSGGTSSIPEHAEPLLRFYRERITDPTSPMQARRKSPWQILFLPRALETFAEISLWNEASHTRSTILYALLANSAYQLHHIQRPDYSGPGWLDIAARHQRASKQHLQMALKAETSGPRQAEYKDLLMAILAVAMVSLYNGAGGFKYFLVDAEHIIRLRGLSMRKKSFKVRILHHMYTYLRIVAESIAVSGEGAGGDASRQEHQNSLATTVPLRRFSITEDTLNTGLDPAFEKSAEVGYNDIHLEIQGRWNKTLYPDLYCIPESLITLLSQVISFANEKSRLESIARTNASVSDALARHIKALEDSVWSWTLPDGPVGPKRPPTQTRLLTHGDDAFESAGGDGCVLDEPNARSMSLALHRAIIIYLYRRVYNMNAMILQDHVKKTLDYLQPCIEESIDDHDFAMSITWPAFIASCEAVSPELQEQALKTLLAIDKKGSTSFTSKPVSQIVPLVWERRASSRDGTLSWPNVMSQGF